MLIAYQDYTSEKAKEALGALKDEESAAVAEVALAYLRGDHYQGGDVWIGPKLTDAAKQAELEKQFVSKNIEREIVKRHGNAVTGREPHWPFTPARALAKGQEPTPEEKKLIADAEANLTAWWDKRRSGKRIVWGTVQGSGDTMIATGKATLRLFIPPVYLTTEGLAERADIATWLSRIQVMEPEPGQAGVVVDEDTYQEAGVFVTERDGKENVELCYLNDKGQTILRVFEGGVATDSDPLELNGNLLIYEMSREALITAQVNQNQALWNMTRTMRTRNVQRGGFPQKDYINVQPPTDESGNAMPHKEGPGVVNYAQSTILTDKEGEFFTDQTGNPTVLPATISYRDPVKVETFEQTEQSAYRAILEEVSQLYVLMSGDATSSGESRIQARADFVMSLLDTKTQIDAAGRWLLETALALASHLAGQAGRFKGLRCAFESRLDPGPLTAEERARIAEEVEKKLMSRQTAMSLLGREDPDSEMTQIELEMKRFEPKPVVRPQLIPPGEPTEANTSEMVS